MNFDISNCEDWQEQNFLSNSHLNQWNILHYFNYGSDSATTSILRLKEAYEI